MQSTMSSTAPTKPKKTPRVRPVPAVSRAIAIVRLLGRSPAPLGVKAIADSLGMVTSTCLHIVRVLVDEGLLRVDESTKRYSLGSGLLSLARSAMQTNPFPSIAQPLLDQIADRWRVTTMAAEIQDIDHMVVVALSRPKVPFRLHVDVGSRFPPLISATGRLWTIISIIAKSQRVRAKRGPMTGSATKQYRRGKILDCFAALAMTKRRASVFPRRISPGVMHEPALTIKRAQGMPGVWLHPQPRVQVR
jgi:IclR helix-turn-helix domain